MTNSDLQVLIKDWVPDLEFTEENSQFLNIVVPKEHLHDLCLKLRDNPDTAFDFLFCLTAVDYPTFLTGVYHLESTKHRHMVVVKTNTENREESILDSVCDIWPTAEFHEREVYDLFGINYTNHPNMKRIFLEDDWVGHPLRKDYVDEVNIVTR